MRPLNVLGIMTCENCDLPNRNMNEIKCTCCTTVAAGAYYLNKGKSQKNVKLDLNQNQNAASGQTNTADWNIKSLCQHSLLNCTIKYEKLKI
jgi:hypothetical protein